VSRHSLAALLALVALGACGSDGDDRRPRPADLDRRLIAAAYDNDVDRARALIARGADVNAEDDTQQSAYLIATSEVGDDPRLLELTLAGGARVGAKDRFDGTGLIRAAERGHARIVRRLLRTDIDVDHVNRLGWTALLEAIVLGDGGPPHVRTVRALVDGGADVDLPDGDGVTPLARAEERGYREIAQILRAAGARR
jgi:ankyrin repeat protein